MIARELTYPAGEMHSAIGQQDLRFADAARIKNNLAGRGIARVIFITHAEIQIPKRHPDRLPAPAHMDNLALEWHRAAKSSDCLGLQLLFETSLEGEVAGVDNELTHSAYPAMTPMDSTCR